MSSRFKFLSPLAGLFAFGDRGVCATFPGRPVNRRGWRAGFAPRD